MLLFTQTLDTVKKYQNTTNTKEYIVLHHTAGGSFEGNMRLLSKAKAEVSAHYVVGMKGEIGKIGNDSDALWHAGNKTTLNGISNYNLHSIGIEVVSDQQGKGYTDIQREAVEDLVKYLMQTYNISKEKIIRHKDITREKIDIDDSFWNNKYKTYEEYINNTYGIMKDTGTYRQFSRLKLFNTTDPDYSKELSAGDVKDLIEIGFTNFLKQLKSKEIRYRKDSEK